MHLAKFVDVAWNTCLISVFAQRYLNLNTFEQDISYFTDNLLLTIFTFFFGVIFFF